jgi:NADH dehydrogenase [ubiquinone] 1 alpha subcomplex assembly factor 3
MVIRCTKTHCSTQTPFSTFFLLSSAEILVLGCGSRVQRVPPALTAALKEQGLAVEAADTANAVATFNILAQEGRAVVAALLPEGV